MSKEDFYDAAHAQFKSIGEVISEEEINAAFPESFPGKNDLVQFYLRNNGGSRNDQGCHIYCGNPEHRVSRDHLENMRIEGFFSITHSDVRTLKYLSMIKYHASRLRTFAQIPEVMSFLERHKPIASDHSGDDCWIDLQSGCIRHMTWNRWKEGPVEIASSFREFVSEFWIHGSSGCPMSGSPQDHNTQPKSVQ